MQLRSLDLQELELLITSMGEKKFRAAQVFQWLSKGVHPENMSNLPKSLREKLSEIPYGDVTIYQKRLSEKDGTAKYLFQLEDDNLVEGVLMRYHYGNTVCLSTQVGCRMGCAFCASTLEGKVRDLTAGEMLGEVQAVENDGEKGKDGSRFVTNLVLMGSGEPLDNFDNVVKFLHLVSNPDGMGISPRNISVSTCGIVPRISEFIEKAPHVTLSVSLHAHNDEIRNQIMPISRLYPIDDLLSAAKKYADVTGRRVVFEYALIDGLNASRQDAKALAEKVRDICCHINLIPLNPVPERNLKGATREHAQKFMKWLEEEHVSATVRREMGTDIEGACGQLRRRVLSDICQ